MKLLATSVIVAAFVVDAEICDTITKKGQCKKEGCLYAKLDKETKICVDPSDADRQCTVTGDDLETCRTLIKADFGCQIDVWNNKCETSTFVTRSISEIIAEELVDVWSLIGDNQMAIEDLQANSGNGGGSVGIETDDPFEVFPFNSQPVAVHETPTMNQCYLHHAAQLIGGESKSDTLMDAKCNCFYDISSPWLNSLKYKFGRGVSQATPEECTCRLSMDLNCVFKDFLDDAPVVYYDSYTGDDITYYGWDDLFTLPGQHSQEIVNKLLKNAYFFTFMERPECYTDYCNPSQAWYVPEYPVHTTTEEVARSQDSYWNLG